MTASQQYRLPTDREWSEAAGLSNEVGATPEECSERYRVMPWGNGNLLPNTFNTKLVFREPNNQFEVI